MNINTGKLLYIASVDITLPEGPSVNEREFAWALHKAFGDRVQMLLMKPAYRIDEISEYFIIFNISELLLCFLK